MEICLIVSKSFSVCPSSHSFPKVCIVPFKILHRPSCSLSKPRPWLYLYFAFHIFTSQFSVVSLFPFWLIFSSGENPCSLSPKVQRSLFRGVQEGLCTISTEISNKITTVQSKSIFREENCSKGSHSEKCSSDCSNCNLMLLCKYV